MWLGLYYPEKDAVFVQPIPTTNLAIIAKNAALNPEADVSVWFDYNRLSRAQLTHLDKWATETQTENVHIKDMNEFDAYRCTSFFKQPETDKEWRKNKGSLIWRQVDAARLLLAQQQGYDHIFYADTDITNLDLNTPALQTRLEQFKIVLLRPSRQMPIDNGFWGIKAPDMQASFKTLYDQTMGEFSYKLSFDNGFAVNGFPAFKQHMEQVLGPNLKAATLALTFHKHAAAKHEDRPDWATQVTHPVPTQLANKPPSPTV